MPNAKRILFVVTQAHWGGVQSFLVRFAAELQKQGHTVLLAAAGDGALWDKAEQAGVPTHRLTKLHRDIQPIQDLAAIQELQTLYHRFAPDAIHLNSSKIGILGSLAAASYRLQNPDVRIVYRIGGWSFLEPVSAAKKWLYLKAEQWTARYKDHILTVHPGDEELAKSLHIQPRIGIMTAPNGLELDSFQRHLLDRDAARSHLGLPSESVVFGLVSNAYVTKGLIPFVQGIDSFLLAHPEAYVCILGDGPQFSELQAAQHASPAKDRIRLMGQMSDATRLYRAFDIFVLPSKKEGMPWALLEAMASGLPCIATDVGACSWMLRGGEAPAGLIISKDQIPQIYAAMELLLRQPQLRTTFGEEAQKQIRSRFSWERTVDVNRAALGID